MAILELGLLPTVFCLFLDVDRIVASFYKVVNNQFSRCINEFILSGLQALKSMVGKIGGFGGK